MVQSSFGQQTNVDCYITNCRFEYGMDTKQSNKKSAFTFAGEAILAMDIYKQQHTNKQTTYIFTHYTQHTYIYISISLFLLDHLRRAPVCIFPAVVCCLCLFVCH